MGRYGSERAAEAGVTEAVAAAMRAHPYGFTWRESAGEIGCIGVQGTCTCTCDMCICKSNSKGVIFRLRAADRTAEIV